MDEQIKYNILGLLGFCISGTKLFEKLGFYGKCITNCQQKQLLQNILFFQQIQSQNQQINDDVYYNQSYQNRYPLQFCGLMIIKYICIITQELCALALFILCFMSLHHNHLGQNIINITAATMLCLRLENIISLYRLYINVPCLENYATFVMVASFSLGRLIENHNPTPSNNYGYLNDFCNIFLVCILILNFTYYITAFLALLGYIFRQLYKLATGAILSSSASLLQQQLQILRRSYKPYQQLVQQHPIINPECSICICHFQMQQLCIVLPGCQHCFHAECIDQWLSSKSNCPYCRSNIRLGLLRTGQ